MICDKIGFIVQVKIVDVTKNNFEDIPRPSNKRFNCQECFYWMGKKDGKHDLVKQKKNWFHRKEKECDGSLGKLLLWGKREKPIGFIQFGPITEFETAQRFYRSDLPVPRGGWCVTCVAIQSAYRRRGLAVRLIRNALRDMKRRGVKKVDAYPMKRANSWNQVSVGPVALWQKCSFEKIKEIKFPKEEGVVVLVRKKL